MLHTHNVTQSCTEVHSIIYSVTECILALNAFTRSRRKMGYTMLHNVTGRRACHSIKCFYTMGSEEVLENRAHASTWRLKERSILHLRLHFVHFLLRSPHKNEIFVICWRFWRFVFWRCLIERFVFWRCYQLCLEANNRGGNYQVSLRDSSHCPRLPLIIIFLITASNQPQILSTTSNQWRISKWPTWSLFRSPLSTWVASRLAFKRNIVRPQTENNTFTGSG